MKYLNALNYIEGVGSQKLALLMTHFNYPEKIWQASFSELIASGISKKLANTILTKKNDINPDEKWKELEIEKISIITLADDIYPKLLREIHNPPYLLYAKGNLSLLNSTMLAIVGSRKFTEYGARVATAFGRKLADTGITIVSGLALGIDAIAHAGALDVKGKTISVLGNGLDEKSIHPRNNLELSKRIIQCDGLLLSEYPPNTPPLPGNFPARNRIMAGISLGTIVIEATLDSGSLITANLALDFNREVFAIPGPIFNPQSQGPHMLIKKGAKLVDSVQDILEEINYRIQAIIPTEKSEEKSYKPVSDEEISILKTLSQEPIHVDTIMKATKLKTSTTLSTLAILEIKGIVQNIGGQNYIKNI